MELHGKRILLIISGGIAAYKALELIRLLKAEGAHIPTILTKGGAEFVTALSISALSGEKTYQSLFDLKDESEMGHIRLSRENDLIVIVPASADIMAKIAHGLADDLATTTVLATDKRVLIAPAMNPMMWSNPATRDNVALLKKRGFGFVGPDAGDMACGEQGFGRLSTPEAILHEIKTILSTDKRALNAPSITLGSAATLTVQDSAATPLALPPLPLSGKKAIVTSGPTYEPIDPVRYIGNRSSGKQGHAIACALRDAGAAVTLITGPVALPDPNGMDVIHVETAQEMLNSAQNALPADIAVCAAAVADWTPSSPSKEKLKKSVNNPQTSIQLRENPDILKTLSSKGTHRPKLVIGFALETNDLLDNAKAKLKNKGCDIILANAADQSGSVFGAERNTLYFIDENDYEEWLDMHKQDVAFKLMEKIAERLNKENADRQAS